MAQDLTGTIIADKYRLDEKYRGGAESDIYSATHRLMDKQVMVRVLHGGRATDEVERDRFFERSKLESTVSSPGVPSVVDFGVDRNGFVYCLYDAFIGDTLHSVIEHDGKFPVHSSIAIGRQIAEAIASAHSVGAIHGNLSAENILLSNDDGGNVIAKVFDLGSPNAIIAEPENAPPEAYSYVAPEICAGKDRSDERSDIYSIGVLLYEMLAGVPPYSGEKPSDVMLKHIEDMPAPLSAFRSDIVEGLEPVVLKALSKDPEMRQSSASALAEELAALSVNAEPKAAAAASGFWKTALMMFIGIGLLASALIYATRVKQTDPITSLQADANGQPVQPLNPATGIEERNLASIPGSGTDINSNLSIPPGSMPGGDGYDPWANAPALQPPGGTVTIPPDGSSPFTMDAGCTMLPSGIVICPTIVPPASPTPTPRTAPPTNTNTGTPAATPTPRPPARTPTPAARPTDPPTNRSGSTGSDGDNENDQR